MSEIKIQDCPVCESKPRLLCILNKIESACCFDDTGTQCFLSNRIIPIGVWNRIRIAPDGESVQRYQTERYGIVIEPSDMIKFEDWMNPRYPDER